MKSAIYRRAQVFLAAGAICLFAALIVPWAEPTPAKMPAESPMAPASNPAPDQGKPDRAAPQAILALFVKRSAPAAALTVVRSEPAPEVRKTVDALWLSYLGFYSGAPGKPYYLLKDTRSGRVIQVSQTGVSNGWSLIEVSEKRLVVQNKDDIYIVNKR